MQYSIWIIPPEPLYSQLKDTINELAEKYNGPLFEPHMTLLGNIDNDLSVINEKTNELVKHVAKLELSLGSVSFSTTYFQSVFVRVQSTAALMDLNMQAKKLFSMENNVFMPHISLLYGDHDMQTREKATSNVHLNNTNFIVKEFIITPATHNPNEWKHSATIRLHKI